MNILATIWKPTKANGGCADNMRLDKVDVKCAASVCARYYKGISSHGCNAVIVGGVEAIAEYLKIKEANSKGYAEAYEGDGVNIGASGSHTRRGRVQNGGVNTLTCANEMGVVVYDEQNKKTHKDASVVNTIMADGSSPKKNARVGDGLRIRKLTPKECWRLQGWCFRKEDGTFDDTAYEKAVASGTSASQLYKQAGNGCSANVVMAIGLKLAEVEKNE